MVKKTHMLCTECNKYHKTKKDLTKHKAKCHREIKEEEQKINREETNDIAFIE